MHTVYKSIAIKNFSSMKSAVHIHSSLAPHPTSGNYSKMHTVNKSEAAKVVVEPASCLHDEAVSLTVHGLESGQEVTLKASMTDIRGVQLHSYAYYKADVNGFVDVNTMESQGGSYSGVFPMGFIGSLFPVLQRNRYTQFLKLDVENPDRVTVSVFRGHLSHDEIVTERKSELLATANHTRHYMAPGVQRVAVRHGRVRGSLFLPPGGGPFPGVIDLLGISGSLKEYRSAQLASRGFVSLALAYYAYDDLPKTLEDLHISYFEEAVQYLLKHDKVAKPKVCVLGSSKGADLSLSLATFLPEVTAAISVNGCISSVLTNLVLHDSIMPRLEIEPGRIEVQDDVIDCYEAVANPMDYPETIIPIEKANAAFLFLVSGDDRNYKSEMYADMASKRLNEAGKNNYTIIRYPEAGHLMEPPFCPFRRTAYNKFANGNQLYGGRMKPHIEAQVHAWEAILGFIRKHLQTCGVPKGKL